ncbi:hypothetical protein AB835_14455 [Candidatus Endobugula sertula]|uniref:Uncharacterized protein n=1 Tax=Candidatus Endobugula sertula TaxID=62101 RepID=A0A1D2QLD8_9GAMM|nr:hypothetical protein AB835_14455 [Candidatus Endobugula sertula]
MSSSNEQAKNKEALQKELSNEHKISLLHLIVAVCSLAISSTIGYLGYSISHSAELTNRQASYIQNAKDWKSFWRDIDSVEQTIYSQMGVVGTDVANFNIAYMEVIAEIMKDADRSGGKTFDNRNTLILAKKTKLLSTYMSIYNSMQQMVIRYENSVLTHHQLVSVLQIKGWNEYLAMRDEFKPWQKRTMRPYDEAYNIVSSMVKSGEVPSDISNIIASSVFQIRSLADIIPPSLQGIIDLKNANYPSSSN